MTVLSDQDLLRLIISKEINITPFVPDNVQPASIDLTLDSLLKRPKAGKKLSIAENTSEREAQYDTISDFKKAIIEPGEIVLAQVHEKILIPNGYTAQIQNRNSLARLGLDVSSASYINPGYSGQLPIVIKNTGINPIELVPFIRICQMVVLKTSTISLRDYSTRADAKYLNEKNSLISLIHEDKEIAEFLAQTDKGEEEFADFVAKRIKRSTEEVFSELTEEQKEYMGI